MNRPTLLASLAVTLAPLVLGAVAACGGNEPAPLPPPPPPPPPTVEPAPTASAAPTPSAEPAATTPPAPAKPPAAVSLKDFATPESVLYDPKEDVYLVSNINGGPSAADNNGFISRVSPDGSKVELKWIEAGKKGVKLDAPKGIAIVGDTLYVADITRRAASSTPRPASPRVRSRSPGATFANDIAHAGRRRSTSPTRASRSTRRASRPPTRDAVYVIEKGKAKVLAKGDELGGPERAALGERQAVGRRPSAPASSTRLDDKGKKQDAQKLPKGMLDGIVAVGDTRPRLELGGAGRSSGQAGRHVRDRRDGRPQGAGGHRLRHEALGVLVPLFQDNAVEAYPAP